MNWKVRIQLLISLLFFSIQMWGAGYDFVPTDGGQVVNLKPGQTILLSTWVDKNSNGVEEEGEEYFVCHYPSYTTGSYFGYTDWDGGKGNFLKLIPQTPGVRNPLLLLSGRLTNRCHSFTKEKLIRWMVSPIRCGVPIPEAIPIHCSRLPVLPISTKAI